jgi:hypothetical protein
VVAREGKILPKLDEVSTVQGIEIFEHRRSLGVKRSVKKLIIPERNALADDTIKACGCLKVWWDQGLTGGQHDV